MSEDTLRAVDLTRIERGRYRVVNPRGGFLDIGEGADTDFTPVELLLAAIAGCTAIDVDHLTTKSVEPRRFDVAVTAVKVSDGSGNRLEDITVSFDVSFPGDDAGAAMAARLPKAIEQSHDRLCTVSRTVELGSPVDTRTAPSRGN